MTTLVTITAIFALVSIGILAMAATGKIISDRSRKRKRIKERELEALDDFKLMASELLESIEERNIKSDVFRDQIKAEMRDKVEREIKLFELLNEIKLLLDRKLR